MNVKPNILELMNPREHARNRNDEPEPFFGSLSMVYQVTRKRGRINKALCVGPALYIDARATVQAARLPWTDEAKRYFIRTASVSYVFEAFVGDRQLKESSYEIFMKRHDICVNGMVKEGFAVSSGSVSAVVERIKEDIPEKDDEGAVVVVRVEAVEQKSVKESWSSSVIDAFKVTCGKFKRFSISLHGPSFHGALPVILTTLRTSTRQSTDGSQLPAKPIEKNIFVGKPGYVDNNGLIYLEQEPVLNALRKVINAKFADSSAIDKFYSDNEPCMAKFHQDNKFYRAIVRKAIRGRRYKVQFIDYGNLINLMMYNLMLVVAVFSFVYGNPLRIINGYDSFGNTCGVKSNEKFAKFPLSGMNTVDKPYVFFLDIKELRQTLKICVKECPKQQINSSMELYKYYEDRDTKYCRYDFDMSLLKTQQSSDPKYFAFAGPCPTIPVYKSKPVLHRCIPSGKNAPLHQVKDMYALINSWGAAQQVFSDLYKTWPTVVLVCGLSLIFSIILITMLHWLTSIISWLICIFVAVASIGITGVLWWSYYKAKHSMDTDAKLSYLEELVRNESTIYVLAILATCIMIILLVIIYYLREKLSGLAALFEEAGKCMIELPGLAGPPLLACIALAIFLTFWVVVIVCLATSNYPNVRPLLPFTQLKENPANASFCQELDSTG
ncbi:conserved hypothetical protein [Culex quinquefasciatus]|uniref:Choline transporter-like protein n=1 Tax=Culex quinquefasciatus TaxID=7176 RepID=B0WZP0_CULQU|nr:conserved hypothetical protein [Culex quinquefasciatus]|eukprot:XP_001862862.1 conserved hypothetical protein [Culex quinquefasciatus]